MLGTSLQALLYSVLPFLLQASGLSEPALWRIAGAIMLVGLAIGGTTDIYMVRRVPRHQFGGIDRLIQAVIVSFGSATLVALLLSTVGFVPRPFAAYLGGLFFFLLLSSLSFVRLLTTISFRQAQ